jgi:hypothetical protein
MKSFGNQRRNSCVFTFNLEHDAKPSNILVTEQGNWSPQILTVSRYVPAQSPLWISTMNGSTMDSGQVS